MLGTDLSCHVLERDTYVVALLIHLCLGASYVEDAHAASTAASAEASHKEEPQENEECQWRDAHQKVHETVACLNLILQLAFELACGALSLYKLLHLVYAAIHHVNAGVGAGLLL